MLDSFGLFLNTTNLKMKRKYIMVYCKHQHQCRHNVTMTVAVGGLRLNLLSNNYCPLFCLLDTTAFADIVPQQLGNRRHQREKNYLI